MPAAARRVLEQMTHPSDEQRVLLQATEKLATATCQPRRVKKKDKSQKLLESISDKKGAAAGTDPLKHCGYLYERGAAMLKARHEAKDPILRKEEEELAECTFKPEINKVSKAIVSRRYSKPLTFYERQEAWLAKREAWIAEERAQKPPEEDLSECTFTPQISELPRCYDRSGGRKGAAGMSLGSSADDVAKGRMPAVGAGWPTPPPSPRLERQHHRRQERRQSSSLSFSDSMPKPAPKERAHTPPGAS